MSPFSCNQNGKFFFHVSFQHSGGFMPSLKVLICDNYYLFVKAKTYLCNLQLMCDSHNSCVIPKMFHIHWQKLLQTHAQVFFMESNKTVKVIICVLVGYGN